MAKKGLFPALRNYWASFQTPNEVIYFTRKKKIQLSGAFYAPDTITLVASDYIFSKDFCHMLMQLITWECAGQDPSQLFNRCYSTTYRAVRTKNALGTECYISLGNEIATFLGVTVFTGRDDGPDF